MELSDENRGNSVHEGNIRLGAGYAMSVRNIWIGNVWIHNIWKCNIWIFDLQHLDREYMPYLRGASVNFLLVVVRVLDGCLMHGWV